MLAVLARKELKNAVTLSLFNGFTRSTAIVRPIFILGTFLVFRIDEILYALLVHNLIIERINDRNFFPW